MVWSSQQAKPGSVWELAAGQHGIVARRQLVALGLSRRAIDHRIARGKLHPVMREIYAVGRPQLTRRGYWMAAVLVCGDKAALSHASAAALWGIGGELPGKIDVTVRAAGDIRRPGIRIHRRPALDAADFDCRDGIPVTAIVRTLLDLACQLGRGPLERTLNEANRLDLIDPETLRAALDGRCGQRGVARLRTILDRRTFRLTRSELERLFLPIVGRIGLPVPLTRQRVNGFEVDFYWPDLRLVVEADGLRYHRTPAQQARDRLRDQAHTAAGMTPLRFTHEQVRYEQAHVRSTLRTVARRLQATRAA